MGQNEDHIGQEDEDPSRTREVGKTLGEIGSRNGGYKLLWGEGVVRNLILISVCWLCCMGCESSSSPIFSIRAREAETDFQKKAERLRQEGMTRREAYLKTHPDLAVEIRQSIEKVAICVGMTKDAVRITWGAPTAIQKHTREMWTYTGIDWWDYMGLAEDLAPRERIYVFFVNGSVTGWHDNLEE